MAQMNIDIDGRTGQAAADHTGIAAQLHSIATQLWSLAADRSALAGDGDSGGPVPVNGTSSSAAGGAIPDGLVELVESEYWERRNREKLFGADLFGEPAWDMLLYLYSRQLRGVAVGTSSLARASSVPSTTALRWMAVMERSGILEKCTSSRDGRVRVQKLTQNASALLERFFLARLARWNMTDRRAPAVQGNALRGNG